jgi:hypothetical protein
MVEIEKWGDPPQHWLDFAKANVRDGARVKVCPIDDLPDFKDRCLTGFEEHGWDVGEIIFYVNTMKPDTKTGFDDGYPHTHNNAGTLAIIHYIQPGDVPAPLEILENGEIVESIYPETGLSVYMPDDVMHGARRNNGTVDRIALIALGKHKL